MKSFLWLVRRELWENRAIWIIPLALGALLTLAALFGTVQATFTGPPLAGGAAAGAAPEVGRTMAELMLLLYGSLFFATMSIYSYWYLLDCLYADRRDRSILFWKSLPISDAAAVLSKVLVGILAIPLIYFAIADATTLLAAFILSVRLHSLAAGALWRADLWLELQASWAYLILTCAVWYLPVTGWLLVVSAFAKRALVLWSILPPLGVMLAERLLLGTHVVSRALEERLVGYPSAAFRGTGSWESLRSGAVSAWTLMDPAGFLADPSVWIGLLAGAGLIAAAVRLRALQAEAS